MKCRSCGKECVDVGFGNCRECARGDKGKEINVDEVVKEILSEIRVNTTPDDYYATYYNRGFNEGIHKTLEIFKRLLGGKDD